MGAASLVTPSDTTQSIKKTHMFLIANMVVIFVVLAGTIGWIVYAISNDKFPFQKYVRATGPPGTQKITEINKPGDDLDAGASVATGTGTTTGNGTQTPAPTQPQAQQPPPSGGTIY